MKFLLFLFCLPVHNFLAAQDSAFKKVYESRKEAEKVIKSDVYITSLGWVLKEGTDVKLGRGSMPDKTFAFITETPSLLTYNQYTDYDKHKLQHSYNGREAKLGQLSVAGSKKMGFFIVVKIKVGQLSRYMMDIENAIEAGELEIPAQYKIAVKAPEPTVIVKNEVSVADELTKLKKLLDDGVLTKDEYDSQKKKLLEKQ
ncbi:MAG TPA: SHOCT domain-containing protein [Chryseolinea sp.]|nr:SHOCT domain-containing protein [Chryseolinea sp.]